MCFYWYFYAGGIADSPGKARKSVRNAPQTARRQSQSGIFYGKRPISASAQPRTRNSR
jgi:hypothetical protein